MKIKARGAGLTRVLSQNTDTKRQEASDARTNGKIPTKDPDVTQVVYLSELVRCLECQRTVPMGIEVITFRKDGESKKVLRHECYCRAHGVDYETRVQGLAIRHHAQRRRKSD